MKTIVVIMLAIFFCLPVIQAADTELIKLGKNPYIPPLKNPQDCDVLFEKGDYEAAFKCYDNTTMLNPDDAEAWNYKGASLFRLNKLDEALQCFEKTISLQPSHAGGWSNKGAVLSEQGNYEEAIQCYNVAIELNSNIFQPWLSKAMDLNSLDRYEEALQCCNEALRLDPANGETIYLKNQLLEKLSIPKQSPQTEVPANSTYEENKMRTDIISYMVQTIANNLDDHTLSDVRCEIDTNNTVLVELELSKKQWYIDQKNNVSVNITMELNAPLAVRMAVLAYINVVLYYPNVGDLIVNTNINQTYTCPRNRVSASIDREKLAKQIAYKA